MKSLFFVCLIFTIIFGADTIDKNSTSTVQLVKIVKISLLNEKIWSWDFVPIAFVPIDYFINNEMPNLSNGTISCFMNKEGIVWFSGDSINDSACIVVDTQKKYLIYWFKCNLIHKWFITKILRFTKDDSN